jgi:hypothetical protein
LNLSSKSTLSWTNCICMSWGFFISCYYNISLNPPVPTSLVVSIANFSYYSIIIYLIVIFSCLYRINTLFSFFMIFFIQSQIIRICLCVVHIR